MADSTNGLLLWGDDFEAILDVLEDTEEVEEQCAVIVRNVSSKSGNSVSRFRITVFKFTMQSLLDSFEIQQTLMQILSLYIAFLQ